MNTKLASTATTKAIATDLQLLHAILTDAAKRSSEAHDRIQQGDRNGAIGIVAGLDAALKDALALYGAALALHRTTPVANRLGGR